MKHAFTLALGTAMVATLVACDVSSEAPATARSTETVPSFAGTATTRADATGYIVVGTAGAERRIQGAGLEVTHVLAGGAVMFVTSPAADAVATLEGLRGVQHVTRDVELELDPSWRAGLSTFDPFGAGPADVGSPAHWEFQWEKPLIGIPAAHEIATGAGTTIAIVDTGIQPGHPDLGNLDEDRSVAFIGGARIEAGEPIDVFGHGTMVAGIAAAQGVGILGTAPDAELVSIRVFDEEGRAFMSDILLALEYAAEIGADVVNLSLGSVPLPGSANAGGIRGAIERVANGVVQRGTVITAAAGNSATDLQRGGAWARYTSIAGTIGASATGADDLLTFYSNYGTNAIVVAAPGGGMADPVDSYCGILEYFFEDRIVDPGEETQVCFLAPDEAFPLPAPPGPDVECVPCTAPALPFPLNGILSTLYVPETGAHTYDWEGGTSFAAPHVAGLVALVRELEPDMSARRVASLIQRGAEGAPGRSDAELGAGRIDALETLNLLRRGRD